MLARYLAMFGIASVINIVAGCASHDIRVPLPDQRPLANDMRAIEAPVDPAAGELPELNLEEPTGALTLRNALALAFARNPDLAAFSWNVRAHEALALQAGLLPNPEFEVGVEEFARSGELSGVDAAETTIQLGQLIELGGKRGKRKRVARLGGDLSGWDYEAKRLDVYTDVAKAFVDVVAAQERLALSQELVELAEQALTTVATRVQAGRDSPVEQTKASVTLHTTRIELERARRNVEGARQRLAVFWGSAAPEFERAEGALEELVAVPPAEQFAGLTDQNPDVARWSTELEERKAAVELADAGRIPDLTVAAGFKYLSEIDERSLIVGLAIPLPVFNRNQGESLAARYRVAQARAEASASRARTHGAFSDAYRELANAYATAMTLRDDILPAAQSAYDVTSQGYQVGKYGFLDLLDAQRTLFEARREYIDTLADYHRSSADVERLIGRRIDAVTGSPDQE